MDLSSNEYCVIVPTYNNGETLEQVINDIQKYTSNIIVVNDGSTDGTDEILKRFSSLSLVRLPKNKGKGNALREGFKLALKEGYRYAITIDSDNQHKATDIPAFLECIEKEPDALLIGTRNLNQENLPQKSGFANKFSNFWFNFFTGLKLTDTQSGFRLYPLHKIKELKLFSQKYEFELEILIKASWKGIPVLPVAIDVYYPPKEERVTHFRPLQDFTRISMLNTLFFFITVLYIKPYKFIATINKTKIKDLFREQVLTSKDSNKKIILSVMFGVFMGIVPIWGYQMIAAIALAYAFRLNKIIVLIAANISIAPMIPLIIYLSYITGGMLIGNSYQPIHSLSEIDFSFVKANLIQYILGSIVFGLVLSLAFGFLIYLLLKIFRKPQTGLTD